MSTETVGVIITPDAIRDGLVQNLLDDVLSAGPFDIVWWGQKTFVGAEDVFILYPPLPERRFYRSVIRTMTLGPSIAILIRGENAFSSIKLLKGKLRCDGKTLEVTGLRFKYRAWSLDEIDPLDCENQELMNKIFEFRIHAAEDTAETARVCHLCMTEEEIVALRKIAPEVHSEVRKLRVRRGEGQVAVLGDSQCR